MRLELYLGTVLKDINEILALELFDLKLFVLLIFETTEFKFELVNQSLIIEKHCRDFQYH